MESYGQVDKGFNRYSLDGDRWVMNKFKGEYPPEWTKEFRSQMRAEFDNKCERCSHIHDPQSGYAMTVHHLDNDKGNLARWNLAVLCQRCHLHIQGKVFLPQFYMFEHSDWFKPHVEGYYKSYWE